MRNDLNLSGWIERRRADVGPYADHIIKGVAEYEAEIARLRAALGRSSHFLSRAADACSDGDLSDPRVDELSGWAIKVEEMLAKAKV